MAEEVKKFYYSKTLWLNTIALLAIWVQNLNGVVIDANFQMTILALINLVLRFVTNEKIEW